MNAKVRIGTRVRTTADIAGKCEKKKLKQLQYPHAKTSKRLKTIVLTVNTMNNR